MKGAGWLKGRIRLDRAHISTRRDFYERIEGELKSIEFSGLYKKEAVLLSAQSSHVRIEGQSGQLINFCANNYLGLANHPDIVTAGIDALKGRGAGLSSVRFICGTQDIHLALEGRISKFLGMDDAILYSSCFDANAGLFETLLGPEDAVISDALNHASIIDGIRLCKARKFVYAHSDLKDLEKHLKTARDTCRTVMIATDGVFSMDGELARLPELCELASRYEAILFVDDSHATGFVGPSGRGSAEHFGIPSSRVDILSSTLGKALGGASGGFVAAPAEVVKMLRQKSRPYLFSNTLPPAVLMMADKAIEMIASNGAHLRSKLRDNVKMFRESMQAKGFKLMGDPAHPIAPVMIGDAKSATAIARELLKQGIFVVAFSYPVVPLERARIRVQISAAHTDSDINAVVEAFSVAAKNQGLL